MIFITRQLFNRLPFHRIDRSSDIAT